MAQQKVLTIRLCPDEAHRADVVARTEGISVNEVVRQALGYYFELKRADPEFMTRAKAMVARDAEVVGDLH